MKFVLSEKPFSFNFKNIFVNSVVSFSELGVNKFGINALW